MLNNNLIRLLPYELGKLFQLQVLGLSGNQLSKECLKLYNEPNGTHKLITYLLDSLQGIIYKYISFNMFHDIRYFRLTVSLATIICF
jgi:CCR4-NOT transcription complex subunit 6